MIKPIIAGLLVASFGINSALAEDYRHDRPSKPYYSYKVEGHKYQEKHGHKKKKSYDDVKYAKVVNVEPITRTLTHKVPEQTCWSEKVRYSEGTNSSATPAILGGLLGATIGHSLGNNRHKSNRIIKTVALGALGASIGHDIGAKNRNEVTHYGNEERCEVSYHTRYEEQVIAYDVQYLYRGKTYYTKMDYHPGNTIPVQVNVRPML